jgi:thiamine-monophosphate kinase
MIRAGKGKLAVKVDMLVEHTDVPRGMNYRQAARKAVAMCVSDFAAKGTKPDSFLISVGVGRDITEGQVKGLARGFEDASREWGVRLVGGDTNEASELIIDCVMIGFARRFVERTGASPGDLLVVTGSFGYPPAGLKILMEGARAKPAFAKKATLSVLRPTPDLELGVAIAPYLTSSMDSSDGLARSVHTLARESKVGFKLTRLPVGEGVEDFAKVNGLDPNRLVFQGGEEYLIVGTVRPDKLKAASGAARRKGGQLLQIGVATSDRGRVVLRSRGRSRSIADEGWTHLRGR